MQNVDIYVVDELEDLLPNTYYLLRGEVLKSYLTDQNSVPQYLSNGSILNFIVSSDEDWKVVAGQINIVEDIQSRDELATKTNSNLMVFVLDASDDGVVGGGMYVYDLKENKWYRNFIYESIDVTLGWSDVVGIPSSDPSEIDEAVDMRHVHSNKEQIDKITTDEDGNLFYDGEIINPVYYIKEW